MAQINAVEPNKMSIYLGHKLSIWSEAKTFLKFVTAAMDSIFLRKSESLQKEIYFAFYGNKEYAESLESSSFNFLADTFKIIADTNELRRSERGLQMTLSEINDSFSSDGNVFNAKDTDIITQVASHWIDNRETICFESVYPVLENKELLDLITDLKIDFCSNMEPHLSRLISSAVTHISKADSSITHGNPEIGNRISDAADEFAMQIGPMLDKLDEEGLKTTRDKAKELNKRKIKTLRGKDWFASTIQRTHKRWREIKLTES